MATTKSTKPAASAPAAAAPSATGAQPTNGLAIAALVVGIIAFISGWAPFWGFIAGVAAIILGVIGLRKPGMKGLSIAGIITGGIAALWSLIVTIFFILAIATVGITGVATSGVINKALDQYNAANKALIEAQKDFKKGETAKFAEFEVKANSVQRNYLPTDTYTQPEVGKEFIVVNVTVKNTATEPKTISNYDLKLNEAGVADTVSYVTVDPVFYGGELSAGASLSGNVVYQVAKGATDLKLQYGTYVYDVNGSGLQNLTFTLAL